MNISRMESPENSSWQCEHVGPSVANGSHLQRRKDGSSEIDIHQTGFHKRVPLTKKGTCRYTQGFTCCPASLPKHQPWCNGMVWGPREAAAEVFRVRRTSDKWEYRCRRRSILRCRCTCGYDSASLAQNNIQCTTHADDSAVFRYNTICTKCTQYIYIYIYIR